MATDRLTLARAFEDAGIERTKAENVAGVVMDAINDHVATKADLTALATKAELGELKANVAALDAKLDGKISKLDAKMTFQQWQLAIMAAMILGILAKLFYR